MQTTVFSEVAEQAEKIRNDAEQAFGFVDPGDEIRQGDLYITALSKLPAHVTKIDKPQAQLAPGNTQGSRHTIRDMKGVTLYRVKDAGPLDGPIIVADEEIAIDHPEHANMVLPAGCYAVTYQRAFAEELRRVQD